MPGELPAMTERRRADPLPLGGDGLPYSKGLMARALMAAGVSAERAYELARRVEQDLVARGEAQVDLDRLEELARRGARRGGGRADAPPPAPLRAAARARPAAHRADRRRDRHRQVDGRDRGRLPARDHPRHARPTSSARRCVRSSRGSSCPRSTLELRGAGRRDELRDVARLRFLEQTRNVLVGVRARDRPGAPGGLVDGARGRPPRAGDAPRRSRARSSSSACSRSRTRRCTRRTSGSATRAPTASGRSRSTSTRCRTSG